jgi:CHAD domain-containing protein
MVTAVSRFPQLPAAPAGDSARALKLPSEPPLTPDSPMIALAYRCLRREYGALLKLQRQRAATPTPENVHQTRIATRRMRVVLRLFGALLPRRATARLTKELRWFAHTLGAVRDLDVHTEALREHLQTAGAVAMQELGGYELALRRDRVAAHEKLHTLFASERYEALMAFLAETLNDAPSPAALRRWRSFTIRAGAAHYLKPSHKRVVKLGKKLGSKSGADDLHRLRIRTKRFRYALEFFAEPYPALEPAAKAAKALQDVLGALQDARTARGRVLAYTRSVRKRAGLSPNAVGEWGSEQHRRAKEARHQLAPEWQRFLAATELPDLAAR